MTMLFITILNMSITASVVALTVMLVRIPMRKAPKIFSYALWGVVLFRLVCPFSIESVFGLMPVSTHVVLQDIVYSQTSAILAGINNVMPTVLPEHNTNPIHTVLDIAVYVWLVGFIALLLYAVIGYVRLKRRVYYATLIRDNVYVTDTIKTPFVLGFIRPKIYMPIGIEPSQYDYILKHEQTHIKRSDYLIKPFAFIALTLHWFNPLIWAAYFLMTKDMEMSCDESVLKKANEDIRSDYSYSLLNLSVKRAMLLSPLAFGESNVKERVKNVLKFKKLSRIIVVLVAVFITIFIIGFALDRNTEINYTDLIGYSQEEVYRKLGNPNETLNEADIYVINGKTLHITYDDNYFVNHINFNGEYVAFAPIQE